MMAGDPNLVVFLYDLTGAMAQPWIEEGRIALIVDIQHPPGLTTEDGKLWKYGADLRGGFQLPDGLPSYRKVEFTFAFPPCDHLAVSGARWFKGKGLRLLSLSVDLFATAAEWCESSGAPYGIENPVSTISTYWRKPDYTFHPWWQTGLEPSDNYTKTTNIWAGNGFVMPEPNVHSKVAEAVEFVKRVCGRMLPKPKALEVTNNDPLVLEWYPDDRIHKCPPGEERHNIRSATPLGFSRATFLRNAETNASILHEFF